MGIFDFAKSKKEETKSLLPRAKKATEYSEKFELSSEGIRFVAIIELLGSPKKYIEDTVKAFVERIKHNKDYKVLKAEISKPRKVKEKEVKKVDKSAEGDLFSTFAEVEIAVSKKAKLFDFCFEYMPSSVEVIEPMNVTFSANDLSAFLTDIQATIHKVDFALKEVNAANTVLNRNMIQMLKNNILLAVRDKQRDLKELAKNVGIPESQLKPFVDKMVSEKEIALHNNKYSSR